MRTLFIIILLVCCGMLAHAQDGFMWRPSTISISLERYDKNLKIGQFIHLKNKLNQGEVAWTMMKIDLPDTWKIEGLKLEGAYIVFRNHLKEEFRIKPPKLNEMDFEILNGGDKPDRQLELIWRKYAKTKG